MEMGKDKNVDGFEIHFERCDVLKKNIFLFTDIEEDGFLESLDKAGKTPIHQASGIVWVVVIEDGDILWLNLATQRQDPHCPNENYRNRPAK
jgi:hypothetical protein